MGKATVLTAYGEGRYLVEAHFDTAHAEAEKQRQVAVLSSAQERIPGLQEEIDTTQGEIDDLADELDAALIARDLARMRTLHNRLAALRRKHLETQSLLAAARLEEGAAQRRLALLDSLPRSVNAEAWCADYTEELSGQVGTIEPGRVLDGGLVIQPGHEDNAAYDAVRDGILQEPRSATAAAAWYNYAMLPGAAKWKPRYRFGTIRDIDTSANTATVDLDPLTCGHQQLNGNQAEILTAVPVRYMECHAEAFETGDPVVVEFSGQDWRQPTVIGFVREPRPCAAKVWLSRYRLLDGGSFAVDYYTIDLDTETQEYLFSANVSGTTYYGVEKDRGQIIEVEPLAAWLNIYDTAPFNWVYHGAPVDIVQEEGHEEDYTAACAHGDLLYLAVSSHTFGEDSRLYGLDRESKAVLWTLPLTGTESLHTVSANAVGAIVTSYYPDARVRIVSAAGALLGEHVIPATIPGQAWAGSTRATREHFWCVAYDHVVGQWQLRRYTLTGSYDGIVTAVPIPSYQYDLSPAINDRRLVLCGSNDLVVYRRTIIRGPEGQYLGDAFDYEKTIPHTGGGTARGVTF